MTTATPPPTRSVAPPSGSVVETWGMRALSLWGSSYAFARNTEANRRRYGPTCRLVTSAAFYRARADWAREWLQAAGIPTDMSLDVSRQVRHALDILESQQLRRP